MSLAIPHSMIHVTNAWVSQAMVVAAKLRIADVLHDGPLHPDELATRIGAHPDATYRLVRMLASTGVFCEQADGRFTNNESSETLREGVPGSIRSVLIAMMELGWRAWGELFECVKTGEPSFVRIHGKTRYEMLDENPELSAQFENAMAHAARAAATAIVGSYDFSRFPRLVDVGGGDGTLLATILQAIPSAIGILFERPSVLPDAHARLAAAGVAARCDCIGGDFFVDPLPGGDALLLKSVLHNWNDEQAATILERCRAALPAEGRVLVLEPLIEPGNAPDYHKLADMHMLVMHGGRERTRAEYERLFSRAGLAIAAVTSTPVCAVVEVSRA